MSRPDFQNQEIKKFSQQANRWWDFEAECKPLHQINPIRLAFIKKHAELAHKMVLDIGCGGGILTEALAKENAHVTGIDLADELIQVAKLHLLESKLKINYQTISVEKLALLMPASFDVITCMEILEHVPNPKTIIEAISKLTKAGGKIFFSTLNRNIKSYLQAIIGAEYLLRLLPIGTHDYSHFIKPSELDRYARASHLNLLDTTGITYNFLKKKYHLTSNIDVNYICCYIKT